MKSQKNPRHLAVELLNKTFVNNSYSNIQLNSGLEYSEMSRQDKKFCSIIYYGVIERRITLDHIISGLASRPLEKLDPIVLNILRCGIYQILYMDSIPDNAAVNESVILTKKMRKASASGMVNAVLRRLSREKNALPELPAEPGYPPERWRQAGPGRHWRQAGSGRSRRGSAGPG